MVVTMMMSVLEPGAHIERQYTHVRRIWQVTKTPCPAFFIYLTKHSTFLQQRRRQSGGGIQQAAPQRGFLIFLQTKDFTAFNIIFEICRQLTRFF